METCHCHRRGPGLPPCVPSVKIGARNFLRVPSCPTCAKDCRPVPIRYQRRRGRGVAAARGAGATTWLCGTLKPGGCGTFGYSSRTANASASSIRAHTASCMWSAPASAASCAASAASRLSVRRFVGGRGVRARVITCSSSHVGTSETSRKTLLTHARAGPTRAAARCASLLLNAEIPDYGLVEAVARGAGAAPQGPQREEHPPDRRVLRAARRGPARARLVAAATGGGHRDGATRAARAALSAPRRRRDRDGCAPEDARPLARGRSARRALQAAEDDAADPRPLR